MAKEKTVLYELKNKDGLPGGGAIEVPIDEFLKGIPDYVCVVCCSNSGLKELPPLPDGLFGLQCEHNEIEKIPNIPSSLKMLWCHDNRLTELPSGLEQCESVEAYDNPFDSNYLNFHQMRYQNEPWYSPLDIDMDA